MPVSNRSGPAGRALISSSLERARRRPPDLPAFADPAGPEVQPLPPGARRLRAARPRNYCVTEEPCAAAGLPGLKQEIGARAASEMDQMPIRGEAVRARVMRASG